MVYIYIECFNCAYITLELRIATAFYNSHLKKCIPNILYHVTKVTSLRNFEPSLTRSGLGFYEDCHRHSKVQGTESSHVRHQTQYYALRQPPSKPKKTFTCQLVMIFYQLNIQSNHVL